MTNAYVLAPTRTYVSMPIKAQQKILIHTLSHDSEQDTCMNNRTNFFYHGILQNL